MHVHPRSPLQSHLKLPFQSITVGGLALRFAILPNILKNLMKILAHSIRPELMAEGSTKS